MKKLGLIINPIAGMGGKVGLKGTDGIETLRKAIELGATKEAPKKAIKALKEIKEHLDNIEIFTYSGDMGEDEAITAGFSPAVIDDVHIMQTTNEDTENAAKDLLQKEVDIILFAGGDGTARNIYSVVGTKIPVIGIPAGVKIHSAVFATNPVNAGKVVVDFFNSKSIELKESEVMDIDEEEFRKGRVTARLFGYMNVPYKVKLVQSLKSGGMISNQSILKGMAQYVVDNMDDDYVYIIGSGTTTREIMLCISIPNTLLGIDIVYKKKIIINDATEKDIYSFIKDKKFKIIISPIGGQGYIFGRGNQQISPRIINKAGKENIIIVSTPEKILSLGGNPLLVDTGSEESDEILKGVYKLVVGYGEMYAYRCF